jgi:hypothetical protein
MKPPTWTDAGKQAGVHGISRPCASDESGAVPDVHAGPRVRAATIKDFLKRSALVCLIVVVGACLLLALQALSKAPGVFLDFENFYTAGMILHRGYAKELYDLPLQEKIERRTAPQAPFQPFVHPPPEVLLFLPLARFPFHTAFLLWSGFNLVLLAFGLYCLRHTRSKLNSDGLLLWAVIIVPLVAAPLALGQDSLLLLPIFLLAFFALKRGQERAAGLILGVGLFRFEIMLPFIFIFFLRRRWKVLTGFLGAAIVGLFVSLALVGGAGLVGYGELLMSVGSSNGGVYGTAAELTLMPDIRGLLHMLVGGALPGPYLFLLSVLGSLLLLCWAAWKFSSISAPDDQGFTLQFCLGTVVALLASYPLFNHELTPLILVAYLGLAHEHTAGARGILRGRSGTALLLLFSLLLVIGPDFGLRALGVVTIVLLGFCAWLSQEISTLRIRAA